MSELSKLIQHQCYQKGLTKFKSRFYTLSYRDKQSNYEKMKMLIFTKYSVYESILIKIGNPAKHVPPACVHYSSPMPMPTAPSARTKICSNNNRPSKIHTFIY